MSADVSQLGLFDAGPPQRPSHRCDEVQPRLVSLARHAAAASDPVERVTLLVHLIAEAEKAVAASVLAARLAGRSWRELGTLLGVPHQTLHRRYGGESL